LNPDISEENDSVAPLVASALKAKGAISQILKARADIEALARFSPSVDALITIGGTGLGSRDDAVEALARIGKIKIHGMAIRPGETSALGQVGVKPVLMLPGRIDAALSAWLLVGTRLLQRLTHTIEVKSGEPVMLARKITSTIGLTEVVLVRCNPSGLEPLAAEHFPLQAIGRAHGWVLVPASAEGYPASATVLVQSLP
jgi:molybdopterin biosynthesis enzyme